MKRSKWMGLDEEPMSMLETSGTDWPAILVVTAFTIGVLVLSLW